MEATAQNLVAAAADVAQFQQLPGISMHLRLKVQFPYGSSFLELAAAGADLARPHNLAAA